MVIFCSEIILKGLNLMASKTNTFKKNNKKQNNLGVFIGSLIILLVVVISFILAPALGDLANKNMGDIEFGSYGKEKITFSRIKNTPFQREIAQLTQSSTANPSDYRTIRTAFNRTVAKSAAIVKFDENGYIITKEQLDDAVLKSAIYNENGSFSSVLFKNTTEARRQEIRDEIERAIKIQTVENYTVREQKRSKSYIDFLTTLSDKKRNFKYITYEYSSYPNNLISNYGIENINKFKEFDMSMITVEKQSQADDIIKKLEEKEFTFAELAKLHSTDNFKNEGGKVPGSILRVELETYFKIEDSTKLDNLTANGSPVILEGENSVTLIKLDSDIIEPDFNKSETRDKVKQYMMSNERGLIEDYFLKKASSVTGNLLSSGKEVKETGLFSINYASDQLIFSSINSVSKDPIFNSARANENFYNQLFDLNSNTISEPIVLGDTISIFQLKEEIIQETEKSDYLNYAINATLANYKSKINEDLLMKSNKFVDNFSEGYSIVTSGN